MALRSKILTPDKASWRCIVLAVLIVRVLHTVDLLVKSIEDSLLALTIDVVAARIADCHTHTWVAVVERMGCIIT